MKSKVPRGVFAVCLVVLGSFGCVPKQDAAVSPSQSGAIPTVATIHPKRMNLVQKTEQPGEVEAYAIVEMFPKVAGYLTQLHADIGDPVKANDLLATLNAPELWDDVHEQEALLEQVNAQLEQSEAEIRVAESQEKLAQAMEEELRAAVAKFEAEAIRWDSESHRLLELANKKSITQKVADEAIQQRDASQASLLEAKARIQSNQAKVNQARALIRKALADKKAKASELAIAQARYEHAKTMANYLEIRAPFDGVITQRGYDVGTLLSPSKESPGVPAFTIAEQKRVRVLMEVPESDSHLIENGRKVNIRIPALSNQLFEGSVSRNSWGLAAGTRTLRCEVDLPNEDGKLRHRMFAKVELLVAERDNVLSIPRSSVVLVEGNPHCVVVIDGEIKRQPIKLGITTPTDVEVVDGLSGTEQVVSANANAFQAGQKVRIP